MSLKSFEVGRHCARGGRGGKVGNDTRSSRPTAAEQFAAAYENLVDFRRCFCECRWDIDSVPAQRGSDEWLQEAAIKRGDWQ